MWQYIKYTKGSHIFISYIRVIAKRGDGLEKLFVKIDSACNNFEAKWPDLQGVFLITCQAPILFQMGKEFLWVHRGHWVSDQRSLLLQRGQRGHGMQFINYPLPYNCGDNSVQQRLEIRSENDRKPHKGNHCLLRLAFLVRFWHWADEIGFLGAFREEKGILWKQRT